jgi:acyl carrier protein
MLMDQGEIYSDLETIFRDVLVNDDIHLTPTTTAQDVEGWDSFNNISIMIAVESQFKIKLTTLEIESFANVDDLVQTIRRKIK